MVQEEAGRGRDVKPPMTAGTPVAAGHLPAGPGIIVSAMLIAVVLCCSPGLADGYFYLDTWEQPVLVAHAEGDTQYYPGDTFDMDVVINNRERDVAVEAVPMEKPGVYDPSTALGVTVRPGAGDAPVTIKSLPMMAGDIGSWDQSSLVIHGTVDRDAPPGLYSIPLYVVYQYVYAVPMVEEDYYTVTPLYRTKEQNLSVILRVLPDVRLAPGKIEYENMVPGTQGYLTTDVENIGYATGTDVTIRLVPADNTTFRMVEDSVSTARFPPGETVTLRTRIAVAEHTAAGSYPATIEGDYRDDMGMVRDIQPVPVAITVSRGAVIEVAADGQSVAPQQTGTITVTYINAGDSPAYNAMARIIGSNAIVPQEDSVMLGTMAPGESRTVQFTVSAGSAIPEKRYVVGTEVKYRDGLGALMLSDPLSYGVDVIPPAGTGAIVSSPPVIIAIAGAVAILAYAVWRLRKRSKVR